MLVELAQAGDPGIAGQVLTRARELGVYGVMAAYDTLRDPGRTVACLYEGRPVAILYMGLSTPSLVALRLRGLGLCVLEALDYAGQGLVVHAPWHSVGRLLGVLGTRVYGVYQVYGMRCDVGRLRPRARWPVASDPLLAEAVLGRRVTGERVFTALVHGQPASTAVVAFTLRGWGGLVVSVYTRPEYRRRGGASACVSRATEYVHRVAGAPAYLLVHAANRPAIGVYERLGYVVERVWAWLSVETSLAP